MYCYFLNIYSVKNIITQLTLLTLAMLTDTEMSRRNADTVGAH